MELERIVYCTCVLSTLWFVQRAFCVDRPFFPSMSLISERLIVPTALRRLWYYVAVFIVIMLLWLPEMGSLLFFWCALTLLFDRHLWSPHLVHFAIAIGAMSGFYPRRWMDVFAVSLYGFGGLQKINKRFITGFVANVPDAFVHRLTGHHLEKVLPRATQHELGLAAAVAEALMGLALCFTDQAYWAIACVHVVVLLSFGPLGRNAFHGIYGWNAYCLYLALSRAYTPIREPVALFWWSQRHSPFMWAFTALFVVLPASALAFNFGERLSFKMHSENSLTFRFLARRSPSLAIPPELEPFVADVDEQPGMQEILLQDYALQTSYLNMSLSKRTSTALGENLSRLLCARVVVELVPK